MDFSNLGHAPPIEGVMTPFPHFVDAGESLDHGRVIMEEHHVEDVPMQDSRALVGIVRRRDIEAARARGGSPAVRDACARAPMIVDASARLDTVLLEMAQRRIECVLVTKSGRLAGIFTSAGACRVLADVVRRRFGSAHGHDAG